MMNLLEQNQSMQNMESSCAVTVIVPVYNAAEYLAMCIESIIYQTISEIQVILVNDGSTDNSLDIMLSYMQRYPEKIQVINKSNGGSASARKTGFERVNTPYFMFVDADDYIEYHTCEKLLACAEQTDADVVLCYGYFFNERTNQYSLFGKLAAGISYEDLLVKAMSTLCGRLFRTSYAKEHMRFEDNHYEDASTTIAMFSQTKKIEYVDYAGYVYNIGREGSKSFNNKKLATLDTIRADQIAWNICNTKYYPQLAARLMNRIANESLKNEVIYDQFVVHAKSFAHKLYPHEDALKKYCPAANRKRYNQLCLEPEDMAPSTVFLNGFDKKENREQYIARVGNAFLGEQTIIWLDEQNCDLSTAPETIRKHWEEGHADFVGTWFAVQKINEQGGVYVGPDIQVNGTFNRMRFINAFFGFQDNVTISARVFGGKTGQEVWSVLARMLERPMVPSVQEAFGWVLCGWGGIHLNGKAQQGSQDIQIFKSRVFSFLSKEFEKDNITSWVPQCDTPEAYFELAQHQYDELIADMKAYYTHEINRIPAGKTSTGGTSPDATRKIEQLEKEISTMKRTLSWRITKPLRAVRTVIRKITKR